MPEKKMKNIKRELIEQKLNLVVEKLMNLGGPENEDELKDAVYRTLGDVALVLYMKVSEQDDCITSTKIRQSIVKK